MKNFILFIGTCFISTMAFFGALAAKNPFPCFGIAFGIWALYLWGAGKRNRRRAERRYHERMFSEYMRSKSRMSIRR